jgi:hypothetical protein
VLCSLVSTGRKRLKVGNLKCYFVRTDQFKAFAVLVKRNTKRTTSL